MDQIIKDLNAIVSRLEKHKETIEDNDENEDTINTLDQAVESIDDVISDLSSL